MQLPEPPPPPLAPLWDRVLRARALPPDLDVQLLYIAIRDRLTHPEWEVRLHALRVLADLLPLAGNALSFPFDQVVDNLGHSSPNVRKAALDALKVFCTHCEDPDCAAHAILDKCSYQNIRPHSANIDAKVNVITGLILSMPSVMAILKKRNPSLDTFPFFEMLGDKLFDPAHRDVAQRSLLKFRRVCGTRDYVTSLSRLDPRVQDKFRLLCEIYDEDSMDVYYAPRRNTYQENNQQLVKINHVFNSPRSTPIRISTESSSEESFARIPYYNNNFGRVIIETEIKFDSDTAITMTVLEETESEKNTASDEDYDSSDRNMLNYSDGESEDTDVVVKKVRFGGESIKIRTPDSENQITSEEESHSRKPLLDKIEENSLAIVPVAASNPNETKKEVVENLEKETQLKTVKKSGIPLPVIHNKIRKPEVIAKYSKVKLKSKSLSELYDYFKSRNEVEGKLREGSGFALTLTEVKSPEKVPSPVEPHREVEVLHNLQRSPVVSPKRKQTRLHLERDGFVLNLLATSQSEPDLLSPRQSSPLRTYYDWEQLDILPTHVTEQLHNTENWIAAVKAADQLHSSLLEANNVKKVEPSALSLVQHMWALSDAVPSARAPAEGAVCALIRSASSDCARRILPSLIARMGRDPLPAALPQALLQRMALHHVVDLIFDPEMIGISGSPEKEQDAQLKATLCLARAAGPAAVLSAVRRRLAGTARADGFCNKLRERLSRPVENIKPHMARSSQLPVPVRRRARSTPPPAAPQPPRRLRPLPDSAPLLGISQPGREITLKRLLSPIPLSDRSIGAAGHGSRHRHRQSHRRHGGMRLWCCAKSAVAPAPSAPPLAPDLVADLPSHTRDSSAFTSYNDEKEALDEKKSIRSIEKTIFGESTENGVDEVDDPAPPPRSPSIRVDDYSEKTNPSIRSVVSQNDLETNSNEFGSRKSLNESFESPVRPRSRKSLQESIQTKSTSRSASPSPVKSLRSGNLTPDAASDVYEERAPCERDVRNALAECIIPVKHEDWEVIVNSLVEAQRLAVDAAARAPAASWRAVVRSAAGHVRSLRSRVARAACSCLGALFEHRGRALDPELEEAAASLLERCADVNRFLRADAAAALVQLACGSNNARAAVALSRRGASHRAGPVRAAAAQALSKLVKYNGANKTLDMPSEPRTVFLRACGELLGDANPETRVQARNLYLALSEDSRFQQMLKEAMSPSRYRAIEKFVDKLRCR